MSLGGCFPHRWCRAELAGVAAACARHGVLLVADEIWADWVLPSAVGDLGGVIAQETEGGGRFVPCCAVAPREGCALITLGAPTKTWSLAGLHASYLVIADEALRRRYLQRAEPAFIAYGGTFATTALLAAYTHGGPWLAAARAHVAANVRFLVDFVSAHVPGVAPLSPEATYLVWLDCSGLLEWINIAPEQLHGWLLRHARLCLSPGDEFVPV